MSFGSGKFGKVKEINTGDEGSLTRVEAGLCKTDAILTRFYTDEELVVAKSQLEADLEKQQTLGIDAAIIADTQARIAAITAILA